MISSRSMILIQSMCQWHQICVPSQNFSPGLQLNINNIPCISSWLFHEHLNLKHLQNRTLESFFQSHSSSSLLHFNEWQQHASSGSGQNEGIILDSSLSLTIPIQVLRTWFYFLNIYQILPVSQPTLFQATIIFGLDYCSNLKKWSPWFYFGPLTGRWLYFWFVWDSSSFYLFLDIPSSQRLISFAKGFPFGYWIIWSSSLQSYLLTVAKVTF